MRIKELLTEAPLPDDWDKNIYDPRVPFAQRIRYARERAERIGGGSSRVAFVIPYQGRKTVLKIAKNVKGMAQNDAESRLLDDWIIKETGLAIPMIDYDERSSSPTWIHTEFAQKIKKTELARFFGAPIDSVISYAKKVTNERDRWPSDISKVDPENEYVQEFVEFFGNYKDHILMDDFGVIVNWGIYKGKPVIVDLGATMEVWLDHYSR